MSKKGKIYVICPGHAKKTGGLEALHQLVHKLQKIGRDAYLVYVYAEANREYPLYPEYISDYLIAQRDPIEDRPENALIVGETLPHFLCRVSKMKKYLWWLSWDFGKNLLHEAKNADRHLFQCHYTKDKLHQHGFTNTTVLSDYLAPELLTGLPLPKENLIVYNPKKGLQYTEQLQDLPLQPLEGFTRHGIKEILSKAKIYIDLGHGPGKDRIPREAVCCNALSFTSTEGSFAYQEDTPISEHFKINLKTFDPIRVSHLLQEHLQNYEQYCHQFDDYRAIIRTQEAVFEGEVKAIFGG